MRRRVARTVAGLGLAACGITVAVLGYIGLAMWQIHDPATRTVAFKSGGHVEAIDFGGAKEAGPVWHFDYRTRIAINDRPKLAAEAAALWTDLQAEADMAERSEVVLMPTNFARRVVFDGWRPIVLSHVGTGFRLKKGTDGVWRKTNGWPAECPE